jgi:hypothetical protein
MSQALRNNGGGAAVLGREAAPPRELPVPPIRSGATDLSRALAEVKGQAQFLLYLADQIEDFYDQLIDETEPGHAAFLCKVLGMYSSQLETKHHGLGEKIAQTCQEVYVTVREYDLA